ncbi:hypothetical protein B0F90DRAFT_1817122 [Multifurca ochricompacta]|uniref:Uncharacterized protein n=1 Tax=Multifurca ochricompacta TaxID=376703 RepID=A0AAD4M4J2_9AGAM|nr:hypothetical protein B0F90DRAFT_1817122 [Multifurca ochricompacta]
MSTPAAASTSQIITIPHIPELFDPDFLNVLLPPHPTTRVNLDKPVSKNTFMTALASVAHHKHTRNAAPAFSSTLSHTLDAFQSLSVQMPTERINAVLSKAWEEDPTLTLRIIWNTRSIHDGKGDKELFYKAFGWLYEHHPRTAIANLSQLVAPVCAVKSKPSKMPHGYWKDLLNILALATLEQLGAHPALFLHVPRGRASIQRSIGPSKMTTAERRAATTAEEFDALLAAKNQKAKTVARDRPFARKALRTSFRALYVAVARLFADELVQQAALMRRAELLSDGEERKSILGKVSLVGKWAPTPSASHDKVTNISTALAILLHHGGAMSSLSRPNDISVAISREDTLVLRSFYQRWVLTPLRAASRVPEPLMAAGRWAEVSYKRVASRCMHINSKHFIKHDSERFDAYLDSITEGKAKISGATLLPHELVAKAIAPLSFKHGRNSTGGSSVAAALRARIAKREAQVVNAQWDAMLSRLRSAGTLDNCLAICDVSGSMGDIYWHGPQPQPILPAVALSMTLAQLAKPPFANVFITFSADPEIVTLQEGLGLADNVQVMVRSAWGMNTDLHAVFVRLLLPLVVQHRVPREDMVKRLFVFSDMQFDAADSAGKNIGAWETNHDSIVRAYAEAGYDVPEIVYWNLADERETVPVEAERKGVALMSGFNPAMMKVFMGEDVEEILDDDTVMVNEEGEEIKPVSQKQEMTPLSIMKRALGMESYDNLMVLD